MRVQRVMVAAGLAVALAGCGAANGGSEELSPCEQAWEEGLGNAQAPGAVKEDWIAECRAEGGDDGDQGSPDTDADEDHSLTSETEFEAWLNGRSDEVTQLGLQNLEVASLVEAGRVFEAAELSGRMGASFEDLYRQAPEDGSELSGVAEDTFLTCATAYTSIEAALKASDPGSLTSGRELLGECLALIDRTTRLLN